MSRTYRHWTEPEIERLRSLVKTMPLYEIARELDRTYSSVRHKMSCLGIKAGPRNWTRKEEQRLIEMVGMMPQAEIAARLKRTISAIKMRIFDLALSERYKWWDSEDDKQLTRLNRYGWSDYDIAIKMNRDRQTILRHRKRLGLPAVTAKDGNRTSEKTAAKIRASLKRWIREQRRCPDSAKSSDSRNSAVRSHRCEPVEAD